MLYKNIFFDLDQTLWDFETNSRETLLELADKYKFTAIGIDSFDAFLTVYLEINEKMWEQHRKGLVDKHTLRYGRFEQTLEKFDITDKQLAHNIANDYTGTAPYKTNMFPNAIETLQYLSKKYSMHIITNGFEEVQFIKIKNCGIESFFNNVVTSEKASCQKPDIRIFQYALNAANAEPHNSIMIGDCLDADIGGARNAGLDQVYFNPKGKAHNQSSTYEIRNLNELVTIL
jgi:putative hydrolase of the HAD superfamily